MDVFSGVVTILVVWITLLALNISRIRIQERVGLGDGGKLSLKKATRAHINALEHTIPFCFIVFILASNGTSQNLLLSLSAVFLISRILHALSYAMTNNLMRQVSAGVTYLCIFYGAYLSLAALL